MYFQHPSPSNVHSLGNILVTSPRDSHSGSEWFLLKINSFFFNSPIELFITYQVLFDEFAEKSSCGRKAGPVLCSVCVVKLHSSEYFIFDQSKGYV